MRGEGGQLCPGVPDCHVFLGLARQAWEPVGTPQQRPQRARRVGGEELSACAYMRTVRARAPNLELEGRGPNQAPTVCQTRGGD